MGTKGPISKAENKRLKKQEKNDQQRKAETKALVKKLRPRL